MEESEVITEELILQFNQDRYRLQNLFDQLSYADLEDMDDLNPYKEWFLKVTSSSINIVNTVTTDLLQDYMACKQKEQAFDTLQERIEQLEIDNEQLRQVIEGDDGVDLDDIDRQSMGFPSLNKNNHLSFISNKSNTFSSMVHSSSQKPMLRSMSFVDRINNSDNMETIQLGGDQNEKIAYLEGKLEELQEQNAKLQKEIQGFEHRKLKDVAYVENIEKELKDCKIKFDLTVKERDSLLLDIKERNDLVQIVEGQKSKLEDDLISKMEVLRQAQSEEKRYKDKHTQLQEYVQKLTLDRNKKTNEIDSLKKKISDLDQIIQNFTTIQENLLQKKTKKKEKVDFERITQVFNEIKEQRAKEKNNDQLAKKLNIQCILSPKTKHVQLVIHDEEKDENVVDEKLKLIKNEIQILEQDFPDQEPIFKTEPREGEEEGQKETKKNDQSVSSDDKSFEKSDNSNLFNKVNLRPFDLHSNTTSRNVSRRNSQIKTQNDLADISQGGLSANVSRSGSFLNAQRPVRQQQKPVVEQQNIGLFGFPSSIGNGNLGGIEDELNGSFHGGLGGIQNDIYQDYSNPGSGGNNSFIDHGDRHERQHTSSSNIFAKQVTSQETSLGDYVTQQFSKGPQPTPRFTPMFSAKKFDFQNDEFSKFESDSQSSVSSQRSLGQLNEQFELGAKRSRSCTFQQKDEEVEVVDELHQLNASNFNINPNFADEKRASVESFCQKTKINEEVLGGLSNISLIQSQKSVKFREFGTQTDNAQVYDVSIQLDEDNSNYIQTYDTNEEEKDLDDFGIRKEKRSPRRMEMYFDQDDLVLRSPNTLRSRSNSRRIPSQKPSSNRNSVIEKMPKKRLRNLSDLNGSEIIGGVSQQTQNNRGQPDVCCAPNCRIY